MMTVFSKFDAPIGPFQKLTWSVQCAAAMLSLFVASIAVAQPGDAPPPGLLIKVETAGRLQAGQAAELVYLEDVGVSDLQHFEGSSGRTHLTFSIDVAGDRFSAIMYGGEWGDAEETLLSSVRVNLVGLWDEYNGAPSLTTKWVEAADAVPTEPAAGDEALEEHDLVLIEGATILQVTKFVSRSLKMHVRFVLRAPGDTRELQGIAYEGTWNSDVLAGLRSGTANAD